MNIRLWTDKKIMKGAEPIYLKGSKDVGILLFHGWSSSPQEFNPEYTDSLAKFLNNLGYFVYVPLRLGQGTEPNDLRGLTWEDWVIDALNHYDDFSKEVSRIVVGGMSTGANLALKVAIERRPIGVISMGTTIFTKHHPLFVFLMTIFGHTDSIRKKTYSKADRDIAMKKVHYTSYPLNSLYQNLRASRATRKLLPKVDKPILIMHSETDNVIDPSSARYIYKHVGSRIKELNWIEDSYHSFTTDKQAGKANEIIKIFIEKITK
ncbi:MAG: hypothetical protein COT88_00580 [Candidatus Colwellbacteria bacterium CG10_big_fil_rev_8_21_14_0_10_41_28]|uniref:Serine aminopeptidase S33 domain-containing protein n=1 Tax=Candidatus Colwellbacteria bacterium CG10_big_fil_rev_8_21_14_0_10_41_28 TaxID=1974539 RepID=A0A2H0VHQ8_9BACT|nr:MAG: hypothetical protein COT88_00580 [Candidatus Colwellbacteria bacterium CG10_big_fil_rev_8_21_14_0_10_41_28]